MCLHVGNPTYNGMTNYHIGQHRTTSNHIRLCGTTSACMVNCRVIVDLPCCCIVL